MKKLIFVYQDSILQFKPLVKKLEQDPRVAQLFNTDLSHIQQYLFTKLKIEPTSKVEVEFDKNDPRLIKMSKINEEDVTTPPIFYFGFRNSHSITIVLQSRPRPN